MDIKIEHKSPIRKKHIPYIAGGAFVLAVILFAVFGNHKPSLRVDARMITVSEVKKDVFNDYVRLTGIVRPIVTIQVSPLESGRVEEIVAEEGATVKKGDILVRLSNPSLTLSIMESEAALTKEVNNVSNSLIEIEKAKLATEQERLRANLDRQQKERAFRQNGRLNDEKLIPYETYLRSKEEYELTVRNFELILERQQKDSITRETQVRILNDNLSTQRTRMQMTRERGENLNVKAPVDGQLTSFDVALGQNIAANSKIGEINDLTDFKIEAQLDEHYIDRVFSGLEAAFERQSQQYGLMLFKVYPDVRGGQFKVDFRFTGGRPDNIRAGQSYYINLELGQADEAILIPRGSFYQTTGGSWIYVVSPDGSRAYRRKIKISRQNPQYYEISEGLEPGEQVITSNYENFGNNEVLILNK